MTTEEFISWLESPKMLSTTFKKNLIERLRSDEARLKAADELARAAQNICNRDTKESELATALAEFYSAGKEQE